MWLLSTDLGIVHVTWWGELVGALESDSFPGSWWWGLMAWLAGDGPRNVTLFPSLALMSVLDKGQSRY